MSDSIKLQLSVQDEQATDEELQLILRSLAIELENQSADVTIAPTTNLTSDSELSDSDLVEKGEPSSSILDIKINLDHLAKFGKWLYERLAGTTTKVKFKYEDIEFEFEGRNDRDRASAMRDFEDFIAKREAAKQAKNG